MFYMQTQNYVDENIGSVDPLVSFGVSRSAVTVETKPNVAQNEVRRFF